MQSRKRRTKRGSRGAVYLQYVIVVCVVGLVVAAAIVALGPVVTDTFRSSAKSLLAIAP
jgi:hypothetical protein